MVTTRSGKKFKFNDEGELSPSEDYHTADEVPSQNEKNTAEEDDQETSESDSDSDSDDAPEEESTVGARQKVAAKQLAEAKKAQALKNEEKEKRRQIDLRNKEQQEIKRAKEQQKEEEKEAAASSIDPQDDELPDYLPEDMFDSLHNDNDDLQNIVPKKKGTHKKFSEDLKEIKRQLKIEKLKKLRMAKQDTVRKGPVHVRVAAIGGKNKIVPKLEVKILGTRDKWLSRKSVNRK